MGAVNAMVTIPLTPKDVERQILSSVPPIIPPHEAVSLLAPKFFFFSRTQLERAPSLTVLLAVYTQQYNAIQRFVVEGGVLK